MKKLILPFFIVWFLSACSESDHSEVPEPVLNEFLQQKPNWTDKNYGFDGNVEFSKVKILTWDAIKTYPEDYVFPKFKALPKKFANQLPPEFRQANWWSLSGPVFYQDFEAFRVYFYYSDDDSMKKVKAPPVVHKIYKLALGAQAKSNTGIVLAEARLLEITGEEGRGIASDAYVEEFHYNSKGEVIYYCKSLYRAEEKVKEFDRKGTKRMEYFPIYPALADVTSAASAMPSFSWGR